MVCTQHAHVKCTSSFLKYLARARGTYGVCLQRTNQSIATNLVVGSAGPSWIGLYREQAATALSGDSRGQPVLFFPMLEYL